MTSRVRRPWAAMAPLMLIAMSAGAGLPAPAFAKYASYEDAFGDALRSAARSDRDLAAFYGARGYAPLWVDDGRPGEAAEALTRLIVDAEIDGLDPDRYRPKSLIDAIERDDEASPRALAKAELLFSRAFLAYARDLRRPRQTGTVYIDKDLAPTLPNGEALLRAAASAPSLRQHVSSMAWMHPVYGDLREAAASERYAREDDRPRVWVAPGEMLRPGATGQRVYALRQRLGLEPFGRYDAPLTAAVREFQAARGLPADGVAGSLTIDALNAQPANREGQVRANLERARVLPAGLGGKYILVDAAGARLWLYENGRVRDTMKVVVGKAAEPTPMLAGFMRYAIVNPYWNIPPDLARNRVAPAVLKDGVSYLKKMRYEVLSDWTDAARVIDPATIDWSAVAAGRTEARIRQLPGRDNAMGKMKFMLPNDLGIYLHDTPDKHLFGEADRHFSSGCVRVEDAARLARWLFGKPLTARSKAPEQRVDLPAPVPVYITYLTAAPAGSGLVFRADPYGRDRRSAGRRAAMAGAAR